MYRIDDENGDEGYSHARLKASVNIVRQYFLCNYQAIIDQDIRLNYLIDRHLSTARKMCAGISSGQQLSTHKLIKLSILPLHFHMRTINQKGV
jgi:hypothetical protein